jgi:hypothetical protein
MSVTHIKWFRELEYRIENSSTLVNILLPIAIYGTAGATVFGFQTYSAFALIFGFIWRFLMLIVASMIFIKLQSYLHRYLMNWNSEADRKINAVLTNIGTVTVLGPLFFMVSPIRHIFSHWALPLSVLTYLIRIPTLPIHQYLNLADNYGPHYDHYHLEMPLTIAISLACGIESIFSNFFVSVLSIIHIITVLASSLTEHIEYSHSCFGDNGMNTDRIFRPVILTHHLIYSVNNYVSLNWFSVIFYGTITALLIWSRDMYVRTIDVSASTSRLNAVQKLRAQHNSFYRYWSSTFEVTDYSKNNKLNIFIEGLRWGVFYPIHIVMTMISNILSGRKKYATLYVTTLDLIIIIFASVPIQSTDRYYLGVLFLFYGLIDSWTAHLLKILNIDSRSIEKDVMRREFRSDAKSIITENSLSEVPSEVLVDAGISEEMVSDLSENVTLSEVTDESTVISTHQNRPIQKTRHKKW